MNTIITIGRQYGSGGKEIGQKLADYYQIPFYDKNIIKIAAQRSDLEESLFENYDEKTTTGFLYSSVLDPSVLGYDSNTFEVPVNRKVYMALRDTIREIADQGPCIFVGRCADYILKDYPNNFSIFIQAPMSFKKQRIHDYYKVPVDQVKDVSIQEDKTRASYYNYYTSRKWGDGRNYHLTIDSSVYGIDGSVALIEKAIELKEEFY